MNIKPLANGIRADLSTSSLTKSCQRFAVKDSASQNAIPSSYTRELVSSSQTALLENRYSAIEPIYTLLTLHSSWQRTILILNPLICFLLFIASHSTLRSVDTEYSCFPRMISREGLGVSRHLLTISSIISSMLTEVLANLKVIESRSQAPAIFTFACSSA